jgi:hypothetical protein
VLCADLDRLCSVVTKWGAPVAKSRFIENTLCNAWSVDEMNRLTQPIQDKILHEMQLNGVLGGASV